MDFNRELSIEILERTPAVLYSMLAGIGTEWTSNNEGAETWSVFDVVGHLIHGERVDWIPRAEIILSNRADKTFAPFDRFAQFTEYSRSALSELLEEFGKLRAVNVEKLSRMDLSDDNLARTGIHPNFGEVTLGQLLSTWVVHDLDHIGQISRVMAKQYAEATGPWIEFLGILKR